MQLSELRAKREAILAIAAKHGATNVRVFGSVARDEATDTSDVDFLMDLRRDRGLLDYVGLILDLEGLLERSVDVGAPEQLHQIIRDRVLREAVPL